MRRVRGSRASEAPRAEPDQEEPAFASLAFEATERFLRVLVRRGLTRKTIEHGIHRAWRRIPKSAYQSGARAEREFVDVSHVLTVWFVDPMYVDAGGEPLRLSVEGPAPSLATSCSMSIRH
jgi:hypothetical protein